MAKTSRSDLAARLPKVEAHLHLDGALSPRTIQKLARAQSHGPLSGSLEEIKRLAVVDEPRENLQAVLDAFHAIYPLLKRADALETAAYDLIEDCARQNVLHAEVRFAPSLNAAPGFSIEAVLDAALRGLERGRRDFGVSSGVIVCLLREPLATPAENEAMLELALARRGKGVVALDLAGNEAGSPLTRYASLFERAKAAGLKTTVHAGEVPGSRDLETALALGIDRLGHAVMLGPASKLLDEVVRRRIPVEVNLTSNVRTGAVRSYADHPLPAWRRAGVAVLPSTDDPGIFGIDLAHEYDVLGGLGMTPAEITALARQGIEALFLPESEKARLRAAFDAKLTAV